MGIVELVVGVVIAVLLIVFVVESHHINDRLRVFLLLLLGDAIGLQCPLPLLWKSLDCVSAIGLLSLKQA